jgi:hypothetical protein
MGASPLRFRRQSHRLAQPLEWQWSQAMRALPIIERVGLVVGVLVVLSLVVFLVAWHLRWNALQRTITAIQPRGDVTIAGPGHGDAEESAWIKQAWESPGFPARGVHDSPVDDVTMAAKTDDAAAPVAAALARLHAMLARGYHPGHAAALQPGAEPPASNPSSPNTWRTATPPRPATAPATAPPTPTSSGRACCTTPPSPDQCALLGHWDRGWRCCHLV